MNSTKAATAQAGLLSEPLSTGVKELQTVDRQSDAEQAEAGGMALVIERLAANPNVDVVKLEKIIELQERIMRHNAKAAFDAAFSKMQPRIPVINEKGQVTVKGAVRNTYALLEDIHDVVKPILAEHGFAIRHRTEWPSDRTGTIRIVGILSHEQGHSEKSAFEAPMDRSEYRTDIQSMGSTVSYGRRYTTLDLLNISTRKADDDGRKAGRPAAPDGYEPWIAILEGEAEGGTKAYEQAWQQSKPDFKTYCANHDRERWNGIKATASAAGRR